MMPSSHSGPAFIHANCRPLRIGFNCDGGGNGWGGGDQVIPLGSISADVIETLRQEGYLEGEAL